MPNEVSPLRSREVPPAVRQERERLAVLLEGLAEDDWDLPSLCVGWRVRDVVAHCIHTHLATPWNVPGEWIRSGFSLDARNARAVARWGSLSPQSLLREYRATEHRLRGLPGEARFGLVEAVVHGEDIARPTGRRLETNPRALVTVVEASRRTEFILHGRRRARGLTLRATDLPWSAGRGGLVEGPLASIVLALNGRGVGLDELSGPGLEILRTRLASRQTADPS